MKFFRVILFFRDLGYLSWDDFFEKTARNSKIGFENISKVDLKILRYNLGDPFEGP